MQRTTLKIEGMHCGMCEAHVNDLVRRTVAVKKVKSSHTQGTTSILSAESLDEAKLCAALAAEGYRVLSVETSPYEKRGLFAKRKK